VAPRVPISVAALPIRPNRGLHITVTRFRDHHGPGAHEHHTWEDRVRIPDLLGVDGVAGAWTFSFRATQQHPTLSFTEADDYMPGELRVRLLYLDDDPLRVSAALAEQEPVWDAAGRGAPPQADGECLLSSPLRTIGPWGD